MKNFYNKTNKSLSYALKHRPSTQADVIITFNNYKKNISFEPKYFILLC